MTLQARTLTLDRSDLDARTTRFDSLPVIDVGDLFSPDLASSQAVAHTMGAACRDVGFMYVVNHGIAQHDIDAVYAAADAFYALPDIAKQRYDINRLGCHRGYVVIGGLAADSHDADALETQ
ncbi:MAG: hypothetical protein B7Y51_10730 [Burkholderiales bacterium 28-67-8]|nr:MAG: hypothetical protein B7Y51_10730 [Burkholderiales bacterium 28-67-8]